MLDDEERLVMMRIQGHCQGFRNLHSCADRIVGHLGKRGRLYGKSPAKERIAILIHVKLIFRAEQWGFEKTSTLLLFVLLMCLQTLRCQRRCPRCLTTGRGGER